MIKLLLSKTFGFLQPIIVIIYSFFAAIGLYALKHSIFWGNQYAFSTVMVFNVGCGFAYFVGWYTCLALTTKSFKLVNTFPGKTQYIFINLLGVLPIKWDTDFFVQWQVKPFELEGLQILTHTVMGYVVNLIFLGILCLFMINCNFPTKIALFPAKKTCWSVFFYVLTYFICLFLLFSSVQNIFAGIYYQASLYWILVYTIVSILSAKKNKMGELQ